MTEIGWNFEKILVRRMQEGWRPAKTTNQNIPKLRRLRRVRIANIRLILKNAKKTPAAMRQRHFFNMGSDLVRCGRNIGIGEEGRRIFAVRQNLFFHPDHVIPTLKLVAALVKGADDLVPHVCVKSDAVVV